MLSVTEALNLDIWQENIPALTYLNGLMLFVAGLSIVRFHPLRRGWPLVITGIGWFLLLGGAYRMFFPEAPQANSGWLPYLIFVFMLMAGGLLCYQGYFAKPPNQAP